MVKAPAKSPTQTQASATNTKKKVKVKKKASRLADARARMYYDLIFEASEAVFGRKGYEGATMQEIADEAGVSLKTLYATYESKQNLYAQIRRERVGAFVAAMREAIESVDDPRDQIRALVETYPAFLLEREDWLRIHLRTWTAWAMRPADRGGGDLVAGESRRLHSRAERGNGARRLLRRGSGGDERRHPDGDADPHDARRRARGAGSSRAGRRDDGSCRPSSLPTEPAQVGEPAAFP